MVFWKGSEEHSYIHIFYDTVPWHACIEWLLGCRFFWFPCGQPPHAAFRSEQQVSSMILEFSEFKFSVNIKQGWGLILLLILILILRILLMNIRRLISRCGITVVRTFSYLLVLPVSETNVRCYMSLTRVDSSLPSSEWAYHSLELLSSLFCFCKGYYLITNLFPEQFIHSRLRDVRRVQFQHKLRGRPFIQPANQLAHYHTLL